MRRFFYLVFFILTVNTGSGAAIKLPVKKHEKAILKTDSSTVITARNFDKAALKAYIKQPEFQYKEELNTDISWWTRFWRWFWNWIGHLFSFSKHPTAWGLLWEIVKILLVLSGVAAVLFVIFKSQGINILGMFRRKSATASIPYSEFFEDINEINFDAEIENAIAKHNYRFAVRLLYLRCLKKLSDAGLIEWQIDKTNSTYINELTDQRQREAFGMLTRQFEYIWYGEFLIDGQVYKNINSSFQDFNKQVA